jgi:hypothetical protein
VRSASAVALLVLTLAVPCGFVHAGSIPHQLLILPGFEHVFDIEGKGMNDPAVQRVFRQVLLFLDQHRVH